MDRAHVGVTGAGLTAALVGATDPAAHLRLWCDAFGFAVAAHGEVDGPTAAALWGAEGPVEVWALAAAGARTGRVHLLRVPGPPPARVPMSAAGLHSLDVYARDLDAAGAVLRAAGWDWEVPPAEYAIALEERSVSLVEGSVAGPDGTTAVLVQPAEPRGAVAWEREPDRPFSELTSLVSTVVDVDAEVAFWAGLGLHAVYDVVFRNLAVERLAGLAPGTDVRLAFLAGATTARVEVLGFPADPPAPGPPARPGRDPGHAGWSLQVADLDAALAAGAPERGPVDVDTPLHGRARVALVRTPGGTAVELVERT